VNSAGRRARRSVSSGVYEKRINAFAPNLVSLCVGCLVRKEETWETEPESRARSSADALRVQSAVGRRFVRTPNAVASSQSFTHSKMSAQSSGGSVGRWLLVLWGREASERTSEWWSRESREWMEAEGSGGNDSSVGGGVWILGALRSVRWERSWTARRKASWCSSP